jgi:hypothetical protein
MVSRPIRPGRAAAFLRLPAGRATVGMKRESSHEGGQHLTTQEPQQNSFRMCNPKAKPDLRKQGKTRMDGFSHLFELVLLNWHARIFVGRECKAQLHEVPD